MTIKANIGGGSNQGWNKKVRRSKEEDDSVWLNAVWYTVVEFLGLKHEYFVIFKYNGESKFKFMVICIECFID